jgi:hypothetical protein
MTTLRTSFSPMKFLISTSYWSVALFFSMLTLMGKLGGISACSFVPRALVEGRHREANVLGIDVTHPG